MTWETRPLGEIADFCLGKMLDAKKNRGDFLPYLANVNVRWGAFELDDLREMRFETHELERFGLKYGDIVMCEGGEPGRCAIWKDSVPGMMFQKALHRIRPFEGVDFRYLFYAFLHKGKLNGFSPLLTGSTIKHLPKEKLAKVEVPLPPEEIQVRIADLLSIYDDLIENNRRRIELLEQSAREFYKEWFVRFRFPGHEHVKIIDGIPDGWSETTLGDSALNFDRKRVPLSVLEREQRVGQYPYYGAAGILGFIDDYLFDGRYLLMGEDGTVVTKSGSPMLQLVEGQFWVNNHAHVLQGDSLSTEYLFCALSLYQIAGHITGVAQPKITQKNMNRIPLPRPTEALISEFDDFARPVFAQVFALKRANESLVAARDLLLPKLMNGDLAA